MFLSSSILFFLPITKKNSFYYINEGKSAEDRSSGFWWIKHHYRPNCKEQGVWVIRIQSWPYSSILSKSLDSSWQCKGLRQFCQQSAQNPAIASSLLLRSLYMLFGFHPSFWKPNDLLRLIILQNSSLYMLSHLWQNWPSQWCSFSDLPGLLLIYRKQCMTSASEISLGKKGETAINFTLISHWLH